MDSAASIQEQASLWWVVLNSEDASSADHRDFGDWVARSPERVEAYLQTARLAKAVKSRDLRWPSTPAEVLIREAKASPPEALLLPSRHLPTARAKQRQSYSFAARFAFGTAAILLIALASAWLISEQPQQFKTAIGEQRSVLLSDGSRVTLNTASKIEVTLRKDRRLVRLIEGEVLFDVAHNAIRPFEVRTGRAVLSDVGTQFNVDMRASATTVTVIEGKVAVDSEVANENPKSAAVSVAPEPNHGPLILEANDRVVITAAGLGMEQHGVSASAAIAWTQRQLVFEHRPLSEVAEEFNRYNQDRIEIESAELKREEVTGVFQAKDPLSFVAFLSSIPGVEIRAGAGGAHIVTVHNNK
jgi:transmembrane sensor